MTDPDSPLPPEQEGDVRRLLAEARHTEPIPAEVAARLDRVLADLTTTPERQATVTTLATRRRRVTGLLVAAAAVVALGVGVGQLVQPDSGGDTAMSSADDGGAGEAETSEQGRDGGVDGPERDRPSDAIASGPRAEGSREPLTVRKRHFAADVRAVQESTAQDRGTAYLTDRGALRASCRSGSWGAGTFVPARYGSEPAVVVLRRPEGDTQVADLFLCGRTEPVRTVSLPAP